jgi:hypothetical protein
VIVLIDGDIFRYRCAFAAERTRYLVEVTNASGHKEFLGFESKKEAESYGERVTKGVNGALFKVWSRKDLQPLENCLQIVKSSLENALEAIQSRFPDEKLDYRIWLSGSKNFRDAIAKTKPYKGNRLETPKPSYYKDVGDYLVASWGAVYSEGIEADDAIGIAAMEARSNSAGYVLVTNDKDLRQIPGEHYDWIKKEFSTVSPKEAKQQLFAQILSGDPTDNIPGLEGIGPATAAKILEGAQSPEEMVDRVYEAYIQHGPKYATPYLMEQWELVYILRKPLAEFGGWQHTREGEYFCSKYLQSSDAASSSSP